MTVGWRGVFIAAYALLMRDYRVRFGRTLFGLIWFLLPLLALVGVAWVVGRDMGLYPDGSPGEHLVRLLAGLICWQLLADAWLEPMRLARRARTILRSVSFDQRSLLVAGGLSALVAFALKLPVLLLALWWFKAPVGHALAWAPLAVLVLLTAGMAMACFTVPISLTLLDVHYAMPIAQYLLLFATPIFYPHPASGLMRVVVGANPFTFLVPPLRNALMGQPPDAVALLAAAVGVVAFLALGLAYFRAKVHLAIAYVGH